MNKDKFSIQDWRSRVVFENYDFLDKDVFRIDVLDAIKKKWDLEAAEDFINDEIDDLIEKYGSAGQKGVEMAAKEVIEKAMTPPTE